MKSMSNGPPKTKQQIKRETDAHFKAAVLDSGHVPLGPVAKGRAAHLRQERAMEQTREKQQRAPLAQDATRVAPRRKKAK
jgi:hypothetical protein